MQPTAAKPMVHLSQLLYVAVLRYLADGQAHRVALDFASHDNAAKWIAAESFICCATAMRESLVCLLKQTALGRSTF